MIIKPNNKLHTEQIKLLKHRIAAKLTSLTCETT